MSAITRVMASGGPMWGWDDSDALRIVITFLKSSQDTFDSRIFSVHVKQEVEKKSQLQNVTETQKEF